MLSAERREMITDIIISEGAAYISDIAERFNVSGETVRRDLAEIAKDRRIRRVHGGAVYVKRPLREAEYAVRRARNTDVKRAIGRHAAKLVRDNDIIAVDAGTDVESFISELRGLHGLKIITNSLEVARILAEKRHFGELDASAVMIGGDIDHATECTFGAYASEMLSRFVADKAFIGATAVSSDGAYAWETSHGVFARGLMQIARKSYLLAESDKLGERSFHRICALSDIDMIITDDRREVPENLRESCIRDGCRLAVVAGRGNDDRCTSAGQTETSPAVCIPNTDGNARICDPVEETGTGGEGAQGGTSSDPSRTEDAR